MQHNKGQQIMDNSNDTKRSIPPLAGKKEIQTTSMPTETPKKRHGLSTNTAYAKVTDVMEVAYTKTSHSSSQPLYTAAQVAPIIDQLATHSTAKGKGKDKDTIKGKLPVRNAAAGTEMAAAAEAKAEAKASKEVAATAGEEQANPFSLPPDSLATWHEARTALSAPQHFYATVQKHYPLHKTGQPKPDPKKRFAVRMLESTLEIEQGLADLRELLKECHRTENGNALEGLRRRVQVAAEGLGEGDGEGESETSSSISGDDE